ncbi:MAG: hypothetical protein WD158_06805 [Balneolaceae bacterium]
MTRISKISVINEIGGQQPFPTQILREYPQKDWLVTVKSNYIQQLSELLNLKSA